MNWEKKSPIKFCWLTILPRSLLYKCEKNTNRTHMIVSKWNRYVFLDKSLNHTHFISSLLKNCWVIFQVQYSFALFRKQLHQLFSEFRCNNIIVHKNERMDFLENLHRSMYTINSSTKTKLQSQISANEAGILNSQSSFTSMHIRS